MQVQCNKVELSLALQELSTVVPASTMIPVLNNVMVSIEDGSLSLTSSDLEIGLTINMNCEASESITTTVPAKLFAEIVRSFPEEKIKMDFQTNSVKVYGKSCEFFLNCIEPSEFPILPKVSGKNFPLQRDLTLHSFERVLPVVLARGEGNIAYSSILLESSVNEFRFVATDGQRIVVSKFWDNADFDSLHILIPPKTFNVLSKIWPKEVPNTQFIVSDREVSFVFETKLLVSRILEADFPAYERVIPRDVSYSFKVNRNDLLNTLQRIYLIVRNSTKRVSLSLKSNNLTISGQDPEKGWATETIPVIDSGGCELESIFDAKKLIDGIMGVDTAEAVFETEGPFHPLLIKEFDSDKYTYVLVSLKSP
jgi:DNA polymerase-3 subunit beta